MKSLYEMATVAEVKDRLAQLESTTPRLWGKMDAAQMLAHCSLNMESVIESKMPPSIFIGKLIGRFFRNQFVGDKPFRKSSPTAPSFVVAGARDLDIEREKLVGLIDRFQAGGEEACTREPHCFFGPFTPEEWGKGMYKHLDHHLQQFGV